MLFRSPIIEFLTQAIENEEELMIETVLKVIEAFEDAMNEPSDEPTPEERIAAALEFQNVMSLEDVTYDDPDEL